MHFAGFEVCLITFPKLPELEKYQICKIDAAADTLMSAMCALQLSRPELIARYLSLRARTSLESRW